MEKSSYEEIVQLLFSKEGLLAKELKGYEEREGQIAMALQIFSAYANNEIALIEAGTGIGKSLAYSLPSVFWALKKNEKTVISTHTIALQEQLFFKDLPFLLKILDLDLKAVLVKGMGNYLCLKKFEEFTRQTSLFTQEDEEVLRLEKWQERTKEGSRSTIQFPLSVGTWERLAADRESCTHVHCPHYKECYFFKARKMAEDAHVLIVNHHLLFADLISKNNQTSSKEKSILPPFTRIVLDEAHHIEQIALDALSFRVHQQEFFAMGGKLVSEHPQSGLSLLYKKIQEMIGPPFSHEVSAILQRMEIDIPALKKDFFTAIDQAFTKMKDTFFATDANTRMRLKENAFSDKKELVKLFEEAVDSAKTFTTSIFSLIKDIEYLKSDLLIEKVKPIFAELQNLCGRIEEKAEGLKQFFLEKENRVRWLERNTSVSGVTITLVEAALDVSKYLEENVFEKFDTVALCSATLTTNQNFSFLKKNLGISSNPERVSEEIYHSPFDYQNRCLLAVPSDIADPSSPAFVQEAAEYISRLIKASRGSAFVLFTSYEMLSQCYEPVRSLAKEYTCFKQGDASRSVLLERFQSEEGQVLFGTDSFWEGIDIPGDHLRLVIIVKLPFKVPSDPMVEGYMEFLTKQGRDSFMDYSVPQAAIKFKQGFGRLIRKKTDRGCVICLDKRLKTKNYGRVFLQTLPETKVIFETKEQILKEMGRFYDFKKKG